MAMPEPCRLLLIEDDPCLRASLKAYLEDSGYQVADAADGQQGLAGFRRDRPDLVITDLRMPGMNGYEVLAVLRQEAPSVPVLVITGTGERFAEQQALSLGAAACLYKPLVDLEVLVVAIEAALREAGA
jgi:CheY-like chemotaxis protein